MKKRDILLLQAVTNRKISDKEFRKFVFRFLAAKDSKETIMEAMLRFLPLAERFSAEDDKVGCTEAPAGGMSDSVLQGCSNLCYNNGHDDWDHLDSNLLVNSVVNTVRK